MVKRVMLITEGASDQHVLKPIIQSFWPGVVVNAMPEMDDETDKQLEPGGWRQVLNRLESLNLTALFDRHQLVVVHIDSDVSEHRGFDVPHVVDGKPLQPEELVERVIGRLAACIPSETTQTEQAAILFAIGVHTLECWLVGLRDHTHQAHQIATCLERLNLALAAKGERTIPTKKNSNTGRDAYQKLSKELAASLSQPTQAPLNAGLQSFLAQLAAFKAAQAAS